MSQPSVAVIRAVAAAGVLVLASLVGLSEVREQLRALDRVEDTRDEQVVIDGIHVKAFLGETGTRFLSHVRSVVPERAPVRLVLPPPGEPPSGPTCEKQARFGHFWWVSYALLPRPAYCDGSAKYWVYVGVDPATAPPPAGWELDTFAAGYAVASLP